MVMMDKKGVSPVIATVLLLVLTIVIGGIIFSVVIPFVKDSLGDSKVCLDVLQGVEFPESKFNCYNSTTLTSSSTSCTGVCRDFLRSLSVYSSALSLNFGT